MQPRAGSVASLAREDTLVGDESPNKPVSTTSKKPLSSIQYARFIAPTAFLFQRRSVTFPDALIPKKILRMTPPRPEIPSNDLGRLRLTVANS